MGKNSARQTYTAFTEWWNWFAKETGRVKKVTKKENTQQTTEKGYKVEMKGFRKRKK